MNNNLKSAFLMSRAVVPFMKKQKYGKIIFISSIADSIGFANIAVYSASKSGMVAMANSMVAELGRYNINVNCISPGSTDTPMNQPFLNDPDFIAMLQQRTVSGKVMKSENVAAAAVFLASDDAKAVHGINLRVDDGMLAALEF